MGRVAWVVAVAAFGGCSVQDQTIDIVFDPCEPLALVVDDDANDAERDGVAMAVALWNETAGTRLTVEPTPEIDQVPVRFEVAAGAFFGVYLDEEPAIVINRRLTGERARMVTVAHETGHAFGLEHVDRDDAAVLMNPGNLERGPTPADLTALRSRWGDCPAAAAVIKQTGTGARAPMPAD